MANLDSLLERLPNDLSALLMDPAATRSMEDMLMQRAMGDINQSAGNEAQRVSEAAFGRGMGLSSLNAYAQGQVEQARSKALAQARVDANQAAMQAQRAALGQAAQYATAMHGQQQQADQFRKSQAQQKSLENQKMIYGALGGLGGAAMKGAGYVFGDDIKKGLRGMLGGLGGGSTAQGGPSSASLPWGSNDYQDPMASSVEANPSAISYDMPQQFDHNASFDYSFGGDGSFGGTSYDDSLWDLSDWTGGAGGNTNLWDLLGGDWSF